MAGQSKGSGRILFMVGMIAVTVIPLAIIAPGLADQFSDRAAREERLAPVDSEGEDVAPPPVSAAPPDISMSSESLPIYGAQPSFGEPTMDPSAPSFDSADRPEQPAPPPADGASNGGASGSSQSVASQSAPPAPSAEPTGPKLPPMKMPPPSPSKAVKTPPGPLVTFKAE